MRGRLEAERDRWFLWIPVLYGCGVGVYFSLGSEPGLGVAVAPALVAFTLWAVFRRGTMTVVSVAVLLAVTLGFAAAKLRTEWVTAPVLERSINLAEIRGWVELVEPRPARGQRLTIRVASIRGLGPEALPFRVRVRMQATMEGVAPGDPVRIRASLSPPALPALPGGYDFARAAFFQRLGGVGYALTRAEREEALGPAPVMLRLEARITAVRQAISSRVRAGLDGERGGIADALITGERGGISAGTNQAYRDSGLFHILSISGLHMTIMAGAVFLALRFLLALIPAIALRYPVKKWAAGTATLAAFGYLLISGASFATVRAWVMISIMFLAVLLDRPAIALRNIAVSALLILAVLPESLLDIGFQMSFAAVVALVAAFEALSARRQLAPDRLPPGGMLRGLLFFGAIVLTTLIASIAVAPFGAYHFHTSQQYAIIANLIAIPICNILVMPAALATLVLMPIGLETVGLWVMGIGIDIMSWCAYRVAALPGAVARMPAIPTTAFLAMVAGGLWLCIWRGQWRLLGFGLIAAGVGLAPGMQRPDVLVGHEGSVLAARMPDGRLGAVAGRGGDFELGRWLEHDGDGRSAKDVTGRNAGFRCDNAGCTVSVKGTLVALVRHPSALGDDCARAGLLVLTMPRPPSCVPQGPAIDLFDLRDNGTHAIYLQDAGVRIVSVSEVRGDRPWTRRSARRAGMVAALAANVARTSRLGMFAPPYDLSDLDRRHRPEIEDDEEGR